jgi:hypothetical protein
LNAVYPLILVYKGIFLSKKQKRKTMFNLIDTAKDLGSFSLANTAFAVLLDKALDLDENVFQLFWDKSRGNDDDDIYYDLLVVSDGLREACIPAPLLKDPLQWRRICIERERGNHNRHRTAKHWSKLFFENRLKEVATEIVIQASSWKPESPLATSRYANSAMELSLKYIAPASERDSFFDELREQERTVFLGLDLDLPEAWKMQQYIDKEDKRRSAPR